MKPYFADLIRWLTLLLLMNNIIWKVWKSCISPSKSTETIKSICLYHRHFHPMTFILSRGKWRIMLIFYGKVKRPDKYRWILSFRMKIIKPRLLSKYEEDIVILITTNKIPVLCFTNTCHNILFDAWYHQQYFSSHEEQLSIIQSATMIFGFRVTNLLTILFQTSLEEERVCLWRNHKDFYINTIFNKKKDHNKW